jgi:hypothetical protein
MPKQNPDAELALHKLGQRIREGYAKKHPTTEKNLETVEDAVREQYKREQKSGPGSNKERERESLDHDDR